MNISISENKRDRDTRFMGDQEWGSWKGKSWLKIYLVFNFKYHVKELEVYRQENVKPPKS